MDTQPNSQVENQYLASISPEQLDPELVRKLPLEFLKKQCAIPITLADGSVAVALADPLNIEACDAILSVLAQPCSQVICPAPEIERAISQCYYHNTNVDSDAEVSEVQS